MKNKFIIITLLISKFLFSQENFNSFIYNLYKIDNHSKKLPNELDGIISQNNDTIEYLYAINKDLAKFYPIPKIDNSQQKSKVNLTEIFVKSEGQYYYDYKNQIFENERITSGQTYIVEINKDSLKWELFDEAIPCFEYSCKKAVLTRIEKGITKTKEYKITVWYTNDLPYTVEPFGLIGLNGFIVKINFNGNTEAVLKKMFIKKKPDNIKPFTSGIKISTHDYNKMIDEKLDRYRKYQNQGVDKSN